jgi:hypothetical protein
MRRGAQIIQRSRQHLKILGARRLKCFKCHAEDPFIFGVTVQNSVAICFAPGICAPLVMRMAYPLTKIHNAKRSLRTSSHTGHTDLISRNLVGLYIINIASVWKVCYLLSALQYFGTNIKWLWYHSQLTRKLVHQVLITQEMYKYGIQMV